MAISSRVKVSTTKMATAMAPAANGRMDEALRPGKGDLCCISLSPVWARLGSSPRRPDGTMDSSECRDSGTREAASLVDRVVLRRAGAVSRWRISLRTCWPRPRCGRAPQSGSPGGCWMLWQTAAAALKRGCAQTANEPARWSQHLSRLDVLMTTPRPSPSGQFHRRLGKGGRPFEQPPQAQFRLRKWAVDLIDDRHGDLIRCGRCWRPLAGLDDTIIGNAAPDLSHAGGSIVGRRRCPRKTPPSATGNRVRTPTNLARPPVACGAISLTKLRLSPQPQEGGEAVTHHAEMSKGGLVGFGHRKHGWPAQCCRRDPPENQRTHPQSCAGRQAAPTVRRPEAT